MIEGKSLKAVEVVAHAGVRVVRQNPTLETHREIGVLWRAVKLELV